MSVTLKVLVILGSIFSFIFCIVRIKQSKLKVTNSVMWMLGSTLLVLMAIYTKPITFIAHSLGFEAPVNFIYFIIISYLLLQVFVDNIRICELNEKLKDLNHHIALEEYKRNKE